MGPWQEADWEDCSRRSPKFLPDNTVLQFIVTSAGVFTRAKAAAKPPAKAQVALSARTMALVTMIGEGCRAYACGYSSLRTNPGPAEGTDPIVFMGTTPMQIITMTCLLGLIFFCLVLLAPFFKLSSVGTLTKVAGLKQTKNQAN